MSRTNNSENAKTDIEEKLRQAIESDNIDDLIKYAKMLITAEIAKDIRTEFDKWSDEQLGFLKEDKNND